MNYRHAFHAGNFADVFKHALLCRVLVYLCRKETPFRFIDTHAGIGRYDLRAGEAERTQEWRRGIGVPALRAAPAEVAALLSPYLGVVGPADAEGCPASYPGSPALAQAILRPKDRMVLCELHPEDVARLGESLGRDRRATILARDGYASLRALLPPPERRGIVLIDPPFEARDEFDRLAEAVIEAHWKWPTGTYLLWYPLKDAGAVRDLAETLPAAGLRRLLQLHLFVEGGTGAGAPLAGAGLLAVNPPYVFEAEARALLPFLRDALGRSPEAGWSCRVLAGD